MSDKLSELAEKITPENVHIPEWGPAEHDVPASGPHDELYARVDAIEAFLAHLGYHKG